MYTTSGKIFSFAICFTIGIYKSMPNHELKTFLSHRHIQVHNVSACVQRLIEISEWPNEQINERNLISSVLIIYIDFWIYIE